MRRLCVRGKLIAIPQRHRMFLPETIYASHRTITDSLAAADVE